MPPSRAPRPDRVSMVSATPRESAGPALVDDVGEDALDADAAELGLGRQRHSMPEHRRDHGFDVVGGDVVAVVGRRERACDAQQRDRGTRRHAESEVGMTAGRRGEPHDVVVDARGDLDLVDLVDERVELVGVGDRR